MPDLESVQFDHQGWQQVEKNPFTLVWADDIKQLTAVLSLEYFDKPPEIAVSLADLPSLRFVYRALANQSGAGLIGADVLAVDGLPAIQTIFKLPQPGRGMVYVGSLTIPFAEFSYVIKVQCIELGFTGTREAVVLDQMLARGAKRDQTGGIEGWASDPYDPDHEYPLMPNLAEAPGRDREFPNHALSRVRALLEQMARTTIFSQELHDAEPFSPA